MVCVEDKQFSRDYLDPDKRSIANAHQVFFKDGAKTEEVVVEYPIGHRRRRAEGIPVLEAKFKTNLARRFPQSSAGRSWTCARTRSGWKRRRSTSSSTCLSFET